MKKSNNWVNLLLVSTITYILLINTASAEYLFTAPPRETVEEGNATYGPLVAELSRIMQAEVKYEHPGNWIAYKKKVKSGNYDFIFDGPHFAAWRLKNLDVNPLVRFPGALSFVLVADKNNAMINTKEDLISRKICVLPSPNLGTLTAYAMYPNQVRQPKFVATNGGFTNLMKSYKTGKCDAVLLREGYYNNKLDERTYKSLKLVAKSKSLLNQGITISKRISAENQQLVSSFLISDKGRLSAQNIFDRFSKKSESFIVATKSDYEGQNLLTDNMIFGW